MLPKKWIIRKKFTLGCHGKYQIILKFLNAYSQFLYLPHCGQVINCSWASVPVQHTLWVALIYSIPSPVLFPQSAISKPNKMSQLLSALKFTWLPNPGFELVSCHLQTKVFRNWKSAPHRNPNMISSWRRWASSSIDRMASVSISFQGRNRLFKLFFSVRTTCKEEGKTLNGQCCIVQCKSVTAFRSKQTVAKHPE